MGDVRYGKVRRVLIALLLVSSAVLAVPSAQAAASQEWIVVLEDGTRAAGQANEMARANHVEVTHVFSNVLGGFAMHASPQAAAALERDPHVAAVVPSRTFTLSDIAGWGLFRIDANDAHAVANGRHRGAGSRIIIIDSGVDLDHPDLMPNLDVASGTDCINPGTDPDDDVGHGTHVAGIAAGAYGPDGFGIVGVAPEATIVPIKAFDAAGRATTGQLLCGLDRAELVASDGFPTVVNMSFVDTGTDSTCDDAGPDVMHEAICDLAATGAILVAASGNDAANASTYIPAAFDEVIAVSAYADFDGVPGALAGCSFGSDLIYDCDDTFADFSNWGSDVDVMAPGVRIYSSVPNQTFGVKSGTSMAAPHVSGVVALMLAGDPSLTQPETQALLQDTGECPAPVGGTNNGGSTCQKQGAWYDDPDSFTEPMVNALRAAQRATDSVRWISPRPGLSEPAVFDVAIKVVEAVPGSTMVQWRVDDGPMATAAYNGGTGYYEDTWDASALLPGDYTLSAACVENPSDLYDDFLAEYPPEKYPDEDLRCQTEDVEFEPVLMKCRPGVFLNASPSYGLQALPPAE